MKEFIKKYPYLLLLIGILIGVLVVVIFNNYSFGFSKSKEIIVDDNDKSDKKDLLEDNKSISEEDNNGIDLDNSKPKDNDDNNNVNTNTNKKVINNKAKQDSSTINKDRSNRINEDAVVKYFQSEDSSFKYNNENNSTFRSKAKATFVNCVDFIFYDKAIKGYKFKNLTNSAKIAVLKVVLSIDNKIDTYFPNYKEEIKGSYNNIKQKAVTKYLEVTTSICEKNPNSCQEAKNGFNNMKESFGITWDMVKGTTKKTTKSLKDWYEGFRNS